MQLSAAGLALVKTCEGFRGRAYLDVAGIPTIGYGHRLTQRDAFPAGIDEATAEHMLACDVGEAEEAVTSLVKVSLSQGQFDALVDFVFNLGSGRLGGSTLLRDLNQGFYDIAAGQLLFWDHADMSGVEIEVAGLKARREAEFNLWTSTQPETPAAQGVA